MVGEVYREFEVGSPYGHPSCMNLDVLTDAMSTPEWITAATATVACAEKVARGAG